MSLMKRLDLIEKQLAPQLEAERKKKEMEISEEECWRFNNELLSMCYPDHPWNNLPQEERRRIWEKPRSIRPREKTGWFFADSLGDGYGDGNDPDPEINFRDEVYRLMMIALRDIIELIDNKSDYI